MGKLRSVLEKYGYWKNDHILHKSAVGAGSCSSCGEGCSGSGMCNTDTED